MEGENILSGRVAIVTGAGRGIGREIAISMARCGAKILINDLGSSGSGTGQDATPAQEALAEIEALGGEAAINTDSVADSIATRNMVAETLDRFGRLDIVVNNAGILRDCIFHKMTEEDWDAVISVHLKGSFNISRAAAEIFRKQQSGRMIHMTSTSGLVGNFGQANYAAAKLGIVGLSRSIALDMARFNVTSNAIAPFAWSRLIGTIPAQTEAEKLRVERMKRMTPASVAPLATALASDQAQNVTGQIFAVRANEVFLMGQSRPLRSVHKDGKGWTPENLIGHGLPALSANFYPLERSADVFCWDPV